MSVVSEIKKGSKKIKAAQLDRITDISGRYFAEYNSSTGECKNPVAEPRPGPTVLPHSQNKSI